MLDPLAHLRLHFHRDRVVAGPTVFFAMSRFNLTCGPIRKTLDEAERDADRFHATNEKLNPLHIGWGACL